MRLYRLLLHLYPAAFRAEYGEELREVFAQRRRDASSLPAVLLLWLETIADVVVSAAQTHLDILRQDLRHAARTLRRAPGFAATAIVVAGMGIGATCAVFTVTDHVLIRPLPFAQADRLVKLWEDQSSRGYGQMDPSPANYRDWVRMSTAFDAIGAYRFLSVNLAGAGAPERLEGASVTAQVLPMLGVQPALGRLFADSDDRVGPAGTLLLSHSFWVQRFGADPSVLGRTVKLDDQPYTVIGVMPDSFNFPRREVRVWTAMRFEESDFEDRQNNYLRVLARLRADRTREQARAEMDVVGRDLARLYPSTNQGVGVRLASLRDEMRSATRLLLYALLGAAVGVLLIACANLANLLLARALVRRKELALRASLGAGRERLVRQLLTESLLLAGAGGLFGVTLAWAAIPLLVRLVPNGLPIAEQPTIDPRMLLGALLLTGVTGVLFGVLPAVRAGNADVHALQEGSRGGVGGRRQRLRGALVVATITLSVMLSIGAGLLIRALWRVQAVDPGFRADQVLTLRTSLPMPRYEATASRTQFYRRVLSEVRALPGVRQAAYISFLPIVFAGGVQPIVIEGGAVGRTAQHFASRRYATPGFFEAMGIPLRRGRDIRDSDTAQTEPVAVVSESFVRQHWPGQDPLGRRFTMLGISTHTVVGVVGDVRVRGLERESEPQVYLSPQQVQDRWFTWFAPKDLVVRIEGEPTTLLLAIRRIVAAADPEQPISDVQLLTDVVATDTAPRAAQARVLGAFALVAFLLAGIGIHGLLAFAVSQRTQEIGVRIAIGAQSRDVMGLVLRESLLLALVGVAAGTALAYAAGRAMEALLAGVSPHDPATFAAGVALALVTTLAGTLIPSLRAVRIDPMEAMRAE